MEYQCTARLLNLCHSRAGYIILFLWSTQTLSIETRQAYTFEVVNTYICIHVVIADPLSLV